ncbi:ribosomal-protein-alanine acetyltransferase [Couchioplanes caeruleus subsp. azureus]|nr:ribosomal-protein-alanine acetyltransferase [Couchioplanes caeruleus subsp. azureus]
MTRLLALDDAPRLAQLLRANRDFMAPWEPTRDEDYYTAQGQLAVVRSALDAHQQGACLPQVVLDDSGQVIGRVNLNTIVRGPFQSCSLGYWLNQADNGRGIATAAVRETVRIAFDELGLHRVEAGTLVPNIRSQRVLERNGFVRFGLAPAYLNIAGKWQDHIMYQVINDKLA